MTRRMTVYLGGKEIGTLSEGDRRGAELRFLDSYLEDERRPILSQSFEDDPAKLHREKNPSLPRFFLNLLPEPESRMYGYLIRLFKLAPNDDFGLLSRVGQNLPGAVAVSPDPAASDGFDPALPTDGDEEEDEYRDRNFLRFSLAGVQLKFSVVADAEKISIPARSADGNFILKVAGQEYEDLAANESAMMAWANLAGFDVAPARAVPLPKLPVARKLLARAQREALLVSRFDRSPGGRIHQEDLAQAMAKLPRNKYAGSFSELGPVIRGILGEGGVEEYLRRLTLMVAQGNSDAHLKNWSLRYQDPEAASWSPLYDLVSTVAWPNVQKRPALQLGNAKHFLAIHRADLVEAGTRAHLPAARAEAIVMETLERLRQTWRLMLHQEALPPSHQQALLKHWKRVRVLRDAGSLGSEAD